MRGFILVITALDLLLGGMCMGVKMERLTRHTILIECVGSTLAKE